MDFNPQAAQIGVPWQQIQNNRRMIRSPINSMDKSTVISIYPRLVDEIKPTLQPGHFTIAPGTFDKPSILVVGQSSWWKDIDEEQPMLEINTGSVLVADSIVKDWCNGILCCNMDDRMPGLFWVEGSHELASIKVKFKKELELAQARQRNWYSSLVEMADILWSNSQRNPIAISDQMRLAANELNFKDKDWLRDQQAMNMVPCVACGFLRNAQFPVCQHCHTVVDADLYKKLNLQKAS